MLTNDLILARIKSTRVEPQFLAVDSKRVRFLLNQMLQYVQSTLEVPTSRQEYEETLQNMANNGYSTLVGKGFRKLILDATDFEEKSVTDFASKREEIFTWNATQIRSGAYRDFDDIQFSINQKFQTGDNLYADLSSFDKVLSCKEHSIDHWINRYNLSQVQGLLLQADFIKLTLSEPPLELLRGLIRCAKFHRLVLDIEQKKNVYHIKVAGPLSVTESSRKYGFQLAIFFPVICMFPLWELQAKVKYKKKLRNLKINHEIGLQPTSRNFRHFVPQEIKILAKQVQKELQDVEFLPGGKYIQLGKHLLMADFLFRFKETEIPVEVFHNWHRSALLQRLEQAKRLKKHQLGLLIERKLVDENLEEILKQNFPHQYHFFRELPTPNMIRKLLRKIVEAGQLK